jgi:F420-dependent oxidoreductase-like protein
MRFSVWPSLSQPWSGVLEVVAHAEATGWDGVYVADHFMADGERAGDTLTPMLEATAAMAALAQATERVRLGSLVFGITYRHPAVLAKWAATVDHIAGGRLLLGVGAGWQENEHEQYGIELGPPGVRIDRFVEALDVLTGLLRQPVTSFTGKHYSVTDAVAEPKPVQHPLPLLIGGKGDRMLGVVARYADEWNMWASPDTFAERSGALDARCAAIDRDPSSIARSCQALWFVGVDDAKVDALIERVAPRPAVGGGVERLIESVHGWADVGVDEVIVPDFTLGTGPERLERLDLIIEQVAPAVR